MSFIGDAPAFLPISPVSLQIKRARNAASYRDTYNTKYLQFVNEGWTFAGLEGNTFAGDATLHTNGQTDIDWFDPVALVWKKYNYWDQVVNAEGKWLPGKPISDYESWLRYYEITYMPAHAVEEWNLEAFRLSLFFALDDPLQRFYAGVFMRTQIRLCQVLCAICLDRISGLHSPD